MNTEYYRQDSSEVMKELGTSPEGLDAQEAAQRLEQNGRNKLTEPKKITLARRFAEQLRDPMIIILLVAAAVSLGTALYSGESLSDVFIILFVVLLNAVLGVVQESKAARAIDALKTMTASQSKVIREGKVQTVKSEELVTGDIIMLEAGDSVPCDARIFEAAALKIEESALTGESVPADKNADTVSGECLTSDRVNMAYMGSTVVYGRGTAVVTGTGMNTEIGKIAEAITDTVDEKTPLQKTLGKLSRLLSVLVVAICIFIFAFSVIKAGSFTGQAILSSFMIAISLAVAAIPEGLTTVVTIVLSIGVTRMSRRNAVIRRLTCVETLGCTQVICSDKTGTLTQNKMTVVESMSPDEKLLARGMALCSDAELSDDGSVIGEPTEAALVAFADKIGQNKNTLKEKYPRVGEAPFDSDRKMMTTLHRNGGSIIAFTKGAPDEVLHVCTRVLDESGTERALTDSDRDRILSSNREYAAKALRVLACAYRRHESIPSDFSPQSLERELVFVGLTGMIDPIRPEVKTAVESCKTAGIRTVMITGDHPDTALAIAKELGIADIDATAVTGAELNRMSDEELFENIDHYRVYARVMPEHKVRIVKAWRAHSLICAMTGDGVNDAPSIKTADIGIGMGITGTDVTKNVADMILADDNFATIVSAVREGRKIYDNIRKSIMFLLSSNLSEVIGIFAATVIGFTILRPVHILWINLLTDTFPALALGMEHGEGDIMSRSPRDSREGIFSGGAGIAVAVQGLFIAALTIGAYFAGHFFELGSMGSLQSDEGITMAFLTMSFAEILHSFNLRDPLRSIFSLRTKNRWLTGAAGASLLLTLAVVLIPPVAKLFSFAPVSLAEVAIAIGIAILIIPIVEIQKIIQRRMKK